MHKLTIIALLLLLIVCVLPAQISNYYTFSASTETYATITGTSVPTAIGDNVLSNPVDIGFTFIYGLSSFTQIKISSNGYITLGTLSGSTPDNFLSSTPCPVLAPLWDDTYLQSSAQYLLTGTAPTRIFTIQYAGVKWITGTTTNFNYQVKLYENSKVEFIYGAGVGTPTNASASIGINMLPGGANYFYSVTPGNPATASIFDENNLIDTWPGTNTKYSFNPPAPFTNDLTALSITGNQTPTAGLAYDYTVSVRNSGTAAQSNYTVKIMSGTVQLASVAGPAIAPLTYANVVVPWTPAIAGAVNVTGKVVLTGDANTANDITPPLSLVVQVTGTTALTIGTGNQTARKPVDMSYHNSMFETIFPASEVTLNGVITGVSFYNSFADNRLNMPTKIWLGTTTLTSLSAGWIPAFEMVQVFDGNVSYPIGSHIIHIALNPATPFNYTGGNLVMLVNRPMDANFYSSADVFLCQTVGTNRSRNAYSDAANYDPNSMGTVGTVSGQFPKTTLYMVPASVTPAFSVVPASNNYGQVAVNHTVSQVFTVSNAGGGALTVSSINLTGSPMFNLQNLPTLPVSLSSGQNAAITVQYAPTAAGNHTGTLSITDNLARLVYSVALSGSGIDPTITVLPYTQVFDAVTLPNLPYDWQKWTTGTGTVTSVNTEAYSTPNCVYLNNATSALGPFLISPPLNPALPINTTKTKFRAKSNAGFSLSVGIMTNPQDAATYTEIQNIMLSSVWAEYTVDLRIYTGTGHYIAFKHGQGGNNRNIYIDNIMIESLLQNDLAALSVIGNNTPTVGITSNYAVTVYNWGLNAQNAYQVKLYKEGDVEVASAIGPAISGNSQTIVTIPWVPATAENTYIYGKVVLAADQNNANDQTPHYSVSVQASATVLVEVGSGNQYASDSPVNMYSHTSLYENIYRQNELNHAGLITIVNFYNFFVSNLTNKPTKIWLGMTTQTDLSTGWIPSTQMTQVFDGTVNYPSGINTISIALQQPYTLLQGFNLVMLVQRPLDTMTYNWWDSFACQTEGTNRALIANGETDLNPAAPPTGSHTGQFPKTGFYIIPGGVGNLTGTVYGLGNQPMPNATIQLLGGAQATTNASGQYSFPNIFATDYTVTAGVHGYYDLIQYATVTEGNTATLDFALTQHPTVTLSGILVGSNDTAVGLGGATISLTGYENYQATANAAGSFTITGVYASQTYDYLAIAQNYQLKTGTVDVGNANLDMGNVVINEITFTPRDVLATAATDQSTVTVNWQPPDPTAVDISMGFEATAFPPADWSRIITNNGPPNTSGVYPTWCRFGEVTVGTDLITPAEGLWQAGLWWSFAHQDEWLMTPQFNCPIGASLTFYTNAYMGSPSGEHYYVKASADNGNTWTWIWDASNQAGGWNHYQTPVTIGLSQFNGQQIKLAWHADDPNASSDGMSFVWFIDNIVVANTTTVIRFDESQLLVATGSQPPLTAPVPTTSMSKLSPLSSSHPSLLLSNFVVKNPTSTPYRNLVGYKVWRLQQGQEQNETAWTLLTPETIIAIRYTDPDWDTLPQGFYKWAVRSIYTNDVLSAAMFSNPLQTMGLVTGLVRNVQLVPIPGATVSVGANSATTAVDGSYILSLPAGNYSVTCSVTGYYANTQHNIAVTVGQTTPLNFTMVTVGNDDNLGITSTHLYGNYPNPFNPQTSISFDVKDPAPVRIDIFNLKGQLIRTLLAESKTSGHYSLAWDATDQHGNRVGSGIYQYRMQAGDYTATRRMMLLK